MTSRQIHFLRFLIIFSIAICCPAADVLCDSRQVENPVEGGEVVATVNEKIILRRELQVEVEKDLRKYKKFGMHQANPDLLQILNRRALERIIDNEVLIQEIQKHHVADIDSKAQAALEKMKSGFSSTERYDKYLEARQMSEEELVSSLKNKIQADDYLESRGILHLSPVEKDIRTYYEAHKENFTSGEQVRVRHILIEIPPGSDASVKKAARKQAETIRDKIISGQSFAKLAEEYSDCKFTVTNGGELDFIPHGFMPEEFDRVAFSISPNTISEVVATKFGFHILEVLEHKSAGYLPYEQVRNHIVQYLESKDISKVRAEHVQQLRKQASIKIYLEN